MIEQVTTQDSPLYEGSVTRYTNSSSLVIVGVFATWSSGSSSDTPIRKSLSNKLRLYCGLQSSDIQWAYVALPFIFLIVAVAILWWKFQMSSVSSSFYSPYLFQRQVVRSYSSQLEYPTVPPPIEMPTITVHYPPPTVTQVTPERTPNSEEKASLVSNVGNEQAEGDNKGSLSSWYEDWEIADDDNTWKSAKAPTRLGKN